MCIVPKSLYHYTNLSSLALILKNRRLRFRSLDKMDDMEEGKTTDIAKMAQYVFVSSWTELADESIPFWNMYTKDMTGVRIKMERNPFKKYDWKLDDGLFRAKDDKTSYCFPKDYYLNDRGYVVLPFPEEELLWQVTYSDVEEDLKPKIVPREKEMFLDKVGKYKRKAWEYQKEWRYILNVLPVSKRQNYDPSFDRIIDRIRRGNRLPISFIDLELEDSALNDIEIMTGPKMSEGDRELLSVLVEKYCPSAKTIKSELQIR